MASQQSPAAHHLFLKTVVLTPEQAQPHNEKIGGAASSITANCTKQRKRPERESWL
ncbi:MAG: hypothetical protein ACREP4_08265 [Stenotrophomonas sp.]|uniref:hypothetical protein n=1 Tax=Stenotrophomonas sp. TaxID=69392 RepID=UPI003D6C7F15